MVKVGIITTLSTKRDKKYYFYSHLNVFFILLRNKIGKSHFFNFKYSLYDKNYIETILIFLSNIRYIIIPIKIKIQLLKFNPVLTRGISATINRVNNS